MKIKIEKKDSGLTISQIRPIRPIPPLSHLPGC